MGRLISRYDLRSTGADLSRQLMLRKRWDGGCPPRRSEADQAESDRDQEKTTVHSRPSGSVPRSRDENASAAPQPNGQTNGLFIQSILRNSSEDRGHTKELL